MGDNDTGVLLEDINHQLKAILEGQAAMASVPQDIASMKDDIAELKNDVKAIKAAMRDQTCECRDQRDQLNDHELRITGLEQAA